MTQPNPSPLNPVVVVEPSAKSRRAGTPCSLLPRRRRPAFTLIELLISMSIIAIMATLAIATMYGAQESARDRKTRSTIAKLHTIMMEKYESYRTRRVPVAIATGIRPDLGAKARLDCLRELMRIEMPDTFSDILDSTVSPQFVNASGQPLDPSGSPSLPIAKTSVAQAYARKLTTAKPFYRDDHNRAECLYLIVMYNATDGENPAEMFNSNEVKDTDGDGLMEFVDGWNRPIRFLRWAPGFISELQTRNPQEQPDPFDPRKVYPRPGQTDITFALFPLLYSAGPDGEFDLYGGTSAFTYSGANNNPYAGLVSPHLFPDGQIGKVVDIPANGENNAIDNIHNHLIGSR